MRNTMRKKVILWMRSATKGSNEIEQIFQTQEQELNRYCELHDLEVAATYKCVCSGGDVGSSQEYNELLERVKQEPGFAEVLLITNWDRLARNFFRTKEMFQALASANIVAQSVDGTTPFVGDGGNPERNLSHHLSSLK